MKKFQFKLQAVLTLRQRAEQTALEHYGQALLARQNAIAQLGAAERALAEAQADTRQELTTSVRAGQLQRSANFHRQLEVRRQKTEEALNQAEVELNRAFQKLLLARRDREAMDTHRKRAKTRHARAAAAEEQKALDDLTHRRAPASLARWKDSNPVHN